MLVVTPLSAGMTPQLRELWIGLLLDLLQNEGGMLLDLPRSTDAPLECQVSLK